MLGGAEAEVAWNWKEGFVKLAATCRQCVYNCGLFTLLGHGVLVSLAMCKLTGYGDSPYLCIPSPILLNMSARCSPLKLWAIRLFPWEDFAVGCIVSFALRGCSCLSCALAPFCVLCDGALGNALVTPFGVDGKDVADLV